MRRIYLVDDDESLLRLLGRLLKTEGFDVASFGSPKTFLEGLNHSSSGCVIADLKMPEMSGFEMYEAMERSGFTLPTIFLTGNGAVPDIVLAMMRGAINFLTKPATREELLTALDEAFQILKAKEQKDSEKAIFRRRFGSLTPREREVCIKVTEGLLNKQIASDLGVSEKTIKFHRGRVMTKINGSRFPAELVRMVERDHQVHG